MIQTLDSQHIKEKILKWQNTCHRWAHYNAKQLEGHRNIQMSSYAEQNNASLVPFVPYDCSWTLKLNIVVVMDPSQLLMKTRGRWIYCDLNLSKSIHNKRSSNALEFQAFINMVHFNY